MPNDVMGAMVGVFQILIRDPKAEIDKALLSQNYSDWQTFPRYLGDLGTGKYMEVSQCLIPLSFSS